MSDKRGEKKGESKQSVRVMCRVRPLISREIADKHTTERVKWYPDDTRKIEVLAPGDRGKKNFQFDEVFPPGTSQKHVYDSFAKEAVDAAFQGYHGVLFVYGQTASGKTFTISHEDSENPENLGMIQRAMFDLWATIQKDTESNYTCKMSYVEIYNEKVTDLLGDPKGNRNVKLVSAQRGEVLMYKEGTQEIVGVPVSGYEETMANFERGSGAKSMGSTNVNLHSSRSHTILAIDIEKSNRVTAGGSTANLTALKGRLILCDLAGSERVSKTKAEGTTLKEANNINLSLLVLGNVVKALTEKSVQFAPFRGSQLTRILQYSLSGHGKTSIIVTVSNSDNEVEETIGSINFGQRAIQIKQEAQKHETRDYQALYLELQQQLDKKVDDGIEEAVTEERRRCEEEMTDKDNQIEVLKAENFRLSSTLEAMQAGKPIPKYADPNATKELARQSSTAEILAEAKSGARASSSSSADTGMGVHSAQIIDKLVFKLKESTDNVKTLQQERHDLAAKCREKESTLYALGVRYRDMVVASMQDQKARMQELNDYKAQLAQAQGQKFVPMEMPTEALESEATTPTARMSASPGAEADDTRLLAELQKAYTAIDILREERVNLFVYQKKAEDSIRFLYHERGAGKH